jgi:hypothetical protein
MMQNRSTLTHEEHLIWSQACLQPGDTGINLLNLQVVRPTGIEPVLRVPERRNADAQRLELFEISAIRTFSCAQFSRFSAIKFTMVAEAVGPK